MNTDVEPTTQQLIACGAVKTVTGQGYCAHKPLSCEEADAIGYAVDNLGGVSKPSALVAEAAQAVTLTRTAAELEERAGVLTSRVGVANDRLAVFMVVVPDGYTPEQAAAFKREISKSLNQITADAESEVAYRTMWDKLGDN